MRSARRMRAATSCRPRRQVAICTSRPAATRIGNQPPAGILGMLAARKALSTTRSGVTTMRALGSDHPHRLRITTKKMIDVMNIVLVTAIP